MTTRETVPPVHAGSPHNSNESKHAIWRRNWVLPEGRKPRDCAIALSGGGIRSATFGLGALQALRHAGELSRADYLFGVSGGGYAAGAMQLALQPDRSGEPRLECDRPTEVSSATPSDVFEPGSPEFDHLRRHGRYVADGAREWMIALGVLLRGVVVIQLMALLAMVLLGWIAGKLYALAWFEPLLARPWQGWAWMSLLPLATMVLSWLFGIIVEDWESTWDNAKSLRIGLGIITRSLGVVGIVTTAFTLVIPGMVWLSSWAAKLGTWDGQVGGAVVGSGFLATVTGIFLSARKPVMKVVGEAWKMRDTLRRLPAFLLQRVLVFAGVLVLLTAYLYVFARTIAVVAHGQGPERRWHWLIQGWHIVVVVALLVLLATVVDQTRWSLHPFYKRRIASAFAVRRRGDGDDAHADQYGEELTELEKYGAKVDGFPQVIHIASANVSGNELAPPGRRTVPYTLSGDYVGGPQLKWLPTSELKKLPGGQLKRDLTVQSAMAVSGAAFASAMGASHTPFCLLFTLTNARLGTWLPHPQYADQLVDLPRVRGMVYWLRELFGRYPSKGKLLFVTDGGHYDNLGLVEMLRHGPSVAYCVDGSGGSTLAGSALQTAIDLAREELGVDITFDRHSTDPRDDPTSLEPGSLAAAEMASAGLDPAHARLARSCVLAATVHYPDCAPKGTPSQGRLYFGRAVLTAGSPWDVRAYAASHPNFPQDSTGDQWFEQQQFDAYHALGQHVGEELAKLALARSRPATSGVIL